MAQLRFTLSFHGGKANEHRVSAHTLAKIFHGLNEDIENVCRVISSEDVNIDLREILRSCRLYIVAAPQKGSLVVAVATEEADTKWSEIAGRVYAAGLKQLPLSDLDEDLPKGLTRSVLEHASEYSDPPNGEYEEMRLTIQENGQPEIDVVFDQKLKFATERVLVALSSPSTSVIYGYSVQGILYGLENQNYDDPSARVTVEVDPGDGTRWICSVDKEQLPEQLEDVWTKRVVVHGTATFRQRKHKMDVERIEILGARPDI
ncbi:MAG: hypothetical protein M3R15_13400 [Acidobacteriota bacterium]|nr:hypothetical protein [Acidobacteriota bacterium]